MKKYLLTIVFITMYSLGVFAQRHQPVEEESEVQFKVSHQMIFKSTVTGYFKGIKGVVVFNPKDLASSLFDISVKAAINTGINMRDNDLRKEKYFDIGKFPEITIKSKRITKGTHENEYLLSALLTMKGKTLPVAFPFTALQKNSGYAFKGQFQINRLDYNVGPDNSIDKIVIMDLSVIVP